MILAEAPPNVTGETVEMLKLVANGGAVVAVIAVTVMFLRFIRSERKEGRVERAAEQEQNRKEREVERKAFSDSLERVVAANQSAMRDLSDGIDDVRETTNEINTKLDTFLRKGA